MGLGLRIACPPHPTESVRWGFGRQSSPPWQEGSASMTRGTFCPEFGGGPDFEAASARGRPRGADGALATLIPPARSRTSETTTVLVRMADRRVIRRPSHRSSGPRDFPPRSFVVLGAMARRVDGWQPQHHCDD